MKIDGVSAVAVILILSYAINRIATGLLFLLSFVKPWARFLPEPDLQPAGELRIKAEKKRKLVYFALAGVLAIGVFAGYGTVRILTVSGFPSINPILDIILTGLILVAASDRIADLLKTRAAESPAVASGASVGGSKPIEVTGTLTLIEPSDRALENKARANAAVAET
jgi:hypothetical protein